MGEIPPGGTGREFAVYRDERHLVMWDGFFYVLMDLYTHSRRYYADVRDVFRVINRSSDVLEV